MRGSATYPPQPCRRRPDGRATDTPIYTALGHTLGRYSSGRSCARSTRGAPPIRAATCRSFCKPVLQAPIHRPIHHATGRSRRLAVSEPQAESRGPDLGTRDPLDRSIQRPIHLRLSCRLARRRKVATRAAVTRRQGESGFTEGGSHNPQRRPTQPAGDDNNRPASPPEGRSRAIAARRTHSRDVMAPNRYTDRYSHRRAPRATCRSPHCRVD
jgi:hypothetical protein